VRAGGEEVAVTFDPAVADEHPDTVRLLTFGDRLLAELLASLGEPRAGTGRLVRVRLLDARRPLVAWYRPDGAVPVRVEDLGALTSALAAVPPGAADGLREQAERAFREAVARRLEAERQAAVGRAAERLSALVARGKEVLEQATYVWAARRAGGAGEVPALGPATVAAMVGDVGYPFGPLRAKVGDPPEVGVRRPGWKEVAHRSAKQLEGAWGALRAEADRLVHRIVDAEATADRVGAPLPAPSVESEVL
jgi:hypothetical protein